MPFTFNHQYCVTLKGTGPSFSPWHHQAGGPTMISLGHIYLQVAASLPALVLALPGGRQVPTEFLLNDWLKLGVVASPNNPRALGGGGRKFANWSPVWAGYQLHETLSQSKK